MFVCLLSYLWTLRGLFIFLPWPGRGTAGCLLKAWRWAIRQVSRVRLLRNGAFCKWSWLPMTIKGAQIISGVSCTSKLWYNKHSVRWLPCCNLKGSEKTVIIVIKLDATGCRCGYPGGAFCPWTHSIYSFWPPCPLPSQLMVWNPLNLVFSSNVANLGKGKKIVHSTLAQIPFAV